MTKLNRRRRASTVLVPAAALAMTGLGLAPWLTAASATVGAETTPSSVITMTRLSVLDSGSGEGGAEIASYDATTKQVVSTNGVTVAMDIYDITDPAVPIKRTSIDLTPYGDTVTSVSAKNGVAVVAVPKNPTYDETTGAPTPRRGTAVIVDLATRTVVDTVEIGFLPDGVTFSPDGTKVVIANEGQPECAIDVPGTPGNDTTDASLLNDPVGSVSIVDVTNPAAATVTEVSFESLRRAPMILKGIIVRSGATVAQDFEPEYVAVSANSRVAYVTLQENNAIASINLETGALVRVTSAGFVDRGVVPFDPSDKDSGLKTPTRTFAGVYGMKQADGIATFTSEGRTFLATADEGDAREYTCLLDDVRAKNLTVDATAFPTWNTDYKPDSLLGRAKVTNAAGDVDNDGDIDVVLLRGGRTMSIYDSRGNEVADTGSMIEEWFAANQSASFNGQFNTVGDVTSWTADDRSDDKGAEPEGVAVGQVGTRSLAFVGLERANAMAIFDVTDPEVPVLDDIVPFADYTYSGAASGISTWSPEGVHFIPADASPNGLPLVLTSFELSGRIAIDQVVERVVPGVATGLTATKVTAGKTTVAWTNPSETTSGLVHAGAKVSCQSGSETPLTAEVSGGAAAAEVSGLSKGQRYDCSVVITNALGDGVSSASVTPANTPSAPRRAEATSNAKGKAAVTWVAPEYNGAGTAGGAGSKYTVTCKSGSTTKTVRNVNGLDAVVTGLKAGRNACTVVMTGAIAGDGAAATAVVTVK